MQHKVMVNEEQCKLIAQKLAPLKFRKKILEREYLTFPADDETKLRVYLYSAAICHQTHTLINKQKNLKGWDYIEFVFSNLGKEQSNILDPNFLISISHKNLSQKLRSLFADDGNPANCTLDRLPQRSELLIDIATKLHEKYDGKIMNILKLSDGYLINKGQGLYELLSELDAFSDPLNKKSTVAIKFITESGLLNIKDPENIIPMMDYHMQRVLLRTGCVEIIDEQLKQALLNKKNLSSDEEIRHASVEAARKIAQYSNKSMLDMNDFFWPLGRSCCKEKILCTDKICNKKPCTFFTFVGLDTHDKCILEEVCKGYKDAAYRNYWQPIVDTHYY